MFFLTTVGAKPLLSFPHPLTSSLPVLPPIHFLRSRIHSVHKHRLPGNQLFVPALITPTPVTLDISSKGGTQNKADRCDVFFGGAGETKLRGGGSWTIYGGYVSPEIPIRPEWCEGCCGAERCWGPVSAEERVPSCSDKSHTHPLLDLSNSRSEFSGVIFFLIELIWSAHVKHMGCDENYVTAKILMTGFKNPVFLHFTRVCISRCCKLWERCFPVPTAQTS